MLRQDQGTRHNVTPARATMPPAAVLSIDAMGGDFGPAVVVAGMARSVRKNNDLRFIVHGDRPTLEHLIAQQRNLTTLCDIRHTTDVITMDAKPSQAIRNAEGTSMWGAIETVRHGQAQAVVSCGNTGALMAISILQLHKIKGVNRPAIACLWPSRGEYGFNVMLDCGADVRADAEDLLQYALMGASYARNGLGVEKPRVGLLNVGREDHKGRAQIKYAAELIERLGAAADFDFAGFVEGGDLPAADLNVIVTDGFTGNVALKTGEGTAQLIHGLLKDTFDHSLLSRFAAFLVRAPLRRLSALTDPRRINGGIFLGLNGTVVKSHGAADATGVSAAIDLAARLTAKGFTQKISDNIAKAELTTNTPTHSQSEEARA